MKKVEQLGGAVLTGRFISLERLEQRHHAGLIAAAADTSLFAYMPFDTSKGFAPRLSWFTEENASGRMISYVVRRLGDGAVVGSTSYLNIAPNDAKVEIGSTWYTREAQAGFVNPEAKYLLLQNAFAKNWNRVEFKTDAKNARSRAALKKLGAKEEGILRGHMWMPQGYFRDSVYFSILASEWDGVRAGLEERLKAFEH